MSDVFAAVLEAHRGFLLDAAVHAGWELGVFERRCGTPSRRLQRLLDVLAVELGPGAHPPRPPAPPAHGFGLLAEVIRRDRPLEPPPPGSEAWSTYQRHLLGAGAAAGAELAERFLTGRRRLLDAGGGLGAYSRAFLQAEPQAAALLLDVAEAAALAREELAPFGGRAEARELDLLVEPLPGGHDAVLLANVLHLHPPDACARLVRRAAAALAPGGVLVVKEVRIRPTGPALGVWFALNLALYTAGGDVWAPDRIAGWLCEAGLRDVREERLECSPDSVVVTASANA